MRKKARADTREVFAVPLVLRYVLQVLQEKLLDLRDGAFGE